MFCVRVLILLLLYKITEDILVLSEITETVSLEQGRMLLLNYSTLHTHLEQAFQDFINELVLTDLKTNISVMPSFHWLSDI